MNADATLQIEPVRSGIGADRWVRSALWLGVALIGQTAALRLIEAGPFVRYQHYLTLDRLGEEPLSLGLVLVQAVLIMLGMWRHSPAIGDWLARNPGKWRMLVVAIVLLPLGAAASRDVARFLIELGFVAILQLISLANVFLIVCSLPEDALAGWGDRLRGWFALGARGEGSSEAGTETPRSDRLVWIAAIWVTVVSALLSVFCYERHPHVPDEVVYLLHARYFADGRLDLSLPPVPAAFDLDLMLYETDRWYCPVPPGWPAALAVGVWLGVPWLVNPILAGINVLLTGVLVRQLYDRGTARLVVILLCVSPWALFLAMSYMTHTLTLTCALAAAVALARARSTGCWGWALAAGGLVGAVALIRPLEGLIVGGLLGLWAVGLGGARLRLASLVGFGAGAIAAGSLTLVYNQALTGHPLHFPLNVYTDKYYGPGSNSLGFGPDIGLGWGLDPYPGHGLRDVAVNTQLNLFALNTELLGWSIGGLLPAVWLMTGGLRRPDRLMLAVIAAVIVAHAFYWFSGGPDFGARYWFLVLVPCLVLTARGIQSFAERIDSTGTSDSAGARTVAALGLLCLMTLIVYLPWRAADKYFRFRGMGPGVRELADQHEFGRSLVLVQGRRFPDYAAAAVYNRLDLSADEPIYAWDRDTETRARLLEVYADRPVWIVAGPSLTGNGFQLTHGPRSAQPAAGDAGTPLGGNHVRR